MSEPNSKFTIPKDALGGKQATHTDHGPFYLFSAALPIHRIAYRDSVPRIDPCKVTSCTDYVEWLPEEQYPIGATIVERREFRDMVGTVTREGASLLPAPNILGLVIEMYSPWGVKVIESFVHLDPEEFDLQGFNQLVYPFDIEPWSILTPEQEELVLREGGLAVREQAFKEAYKTLKTPAWADLYGAAKAKLYRDAIEECLSGFQPARAFVNKELGVSDAEIRLRLAGVEGDGKVGYDTRDGYMQWLMARRPINETPAQKPFELKLPDGFGQSAGISKEDLLEILVKASEIAAQRAIQSQAHIAESAVVSVGDPKAAKPAKAKGA